MSRTPLLAGGAAALVAAATLVPLAPAFAAAPDAAWSNLPPSLYLVDNQWTTSGTVGTDDRTPSIGVDSEQAGHLGATLVVRDTATKKTLCTGTKPVTENAPFFSAGCSLERLETGTTTAEAVYVSRDGEQTTWASTPVSIHVVPQRFEIDVTAYDRETDTATLSGTGVPNTTLAVGQGIEGTDFTGVHASADVDDDGRFEVRLKGLWNEGFNSIYTVGGRSWGGGTYFSKDAPLKPAATHELVGSQIVVDVQASEGDRVYARDLSGKTLASAARTADVTRLSFRSPAVETEVFVGALNIVGETGETRSPEAFFTVKEGVGTKLEAAPQVSDVALAGRRVVATAQAEPGAQVTVKDVKGSVIGTRVAGASGVLQLALPAPAGTKAGSHFFIEQAKDGQVSERDDFEIPTD